MEGYFGVTCHVIDENFDFHTFLLACRHLLGRHTAERITSEFEDILGLWDLSSKVCMSYGMP